MKSLETFSQVDQSEFRRADVGELVTSTLDLLRSQWDGRIEVVVELEPLPKLDCYPGALNQALRAAI